MLPNHSPWIKQLNRTREVVSLDKDLKTDTLIIGGGIAGIVTAYFTLRDSAKTVTLVEADKIAHGATGHNGGQITPAFERAFFELVEEFGLDLATEGVKSIESSWEILEEIYKGADLQTPYYRFTGYTGYSSIDEVLLRLKNASFRIKGGLHTEPLLISKNSEIEKQIPLEYKEEYKGLYSTIPHKDLLDLLETKNNDYIAIRSHEKGCMNSALFCEELLGHIIETYKERFEFFEGSPVKAINLKKDFSLSSILGHTVEAGNIVLCTNGFENFSITNEGGEEIDKGFHHSVSGRIGYMTGYIEPMNRAPTAISYFPRKNQLSGDPTGESYFYLTRRPHEHQSKESYNLVCLGGPETVLPNQADYSREEYCSEEKQLEMSEFFKENYKSYKPDKTEEAFCWHGLMGYTPNGVRRIGVEPLNPVLLYNLGCNGIGILPSIYGGKRISQILKGEKLEKSMFDPKDQRETEAI